MAPAGGICPRSSSPGPWSEPPGTPPSCGAPSSRRPRRSRPAGAGTLALGASGLAVSFLRHGLIDEYRLYVPPFLLGRGKPLFPTSDNRPLHLAGNPTFGNGVALLHPRCPLPPAVTSR
ncbi:dihydrofolate reductase family protein [Streptomyces decoyicus]|uniref:dihydrofolate reductase family protein n=1 Tax=Streptomyces decoyicus TaxID=249567 RepID=UPI0039083E52